MASVLRGIQKTLNQMAQVNVHLAGGHENYLMPRCQLNKAGAEVHA